MPIKDILVHLGEDERSGERLDVAASCVSRCIGPVTATDGALTVC